MTKLKSKIKTGLTDLTLFWKKPPKGKYMTFKEIASLSVGGIGVKLVVTCTQAMILSYKEMQSAPTDAKWTDGDSWGSAEGGSMRHPCCAVIVFPLCSETLHPFGRNRKDGPLRGLSAIYKLKDS